MNGNLKASINNRQYFFPNMSYVFKQAPTEMCSGSKGVGKTLEEKMT